MIYSELDGLEGCFCPSKELQKIFIRSLCVCVGFPKRQSRGQIFYLHVILWKLFRGQQSETRKGGRHKWCVSKGSYYCKQVELRPTGDHWSTHHGLRTASWGPSSPGHFGLSTPETDLAPNKALRQRVASVCRRQPLIC